MKNPIANFVYTNLYSNALTASKRYSNFESNRTMKITVRIYWNENMAKAHFFLCIWPANGLWRCCICTWPKTENIHRARATDLLIWKLCDNRNEWKTMHFGTMHTMHLNVTLTRRRHRWAHERKKKPMYHSHWKLRCKWIRPHHFSFISFAFHLTK